MIDGVRQFYLKNKNGQIYDMTRPERLFWLPEGFGWGIESVTERLGLTYFVVEENEVQPMPSGNMVFRTYDEFRRFLQFCYVGGLTLYYSPAYVVENKRWFALDVSLIIDKSEIKPENDHLVCPVQFTGLSYWYELKTYQTITGATDESGKKYPYTYPSTYGTGQSNIMHVNTELDSYFKLTIFGAVTNPQWSIVKNGEVVHIGKVNTEISALQKFVVNTDPAKMEIAVYNRRNDKFLRNAYQESVFSTQRIFSIPKGETSFVVSSDDETQIINAILEVYSRV